MGRGKGKGRGNDWHGGGYGGGGGGGYGGGGGGGNKPFWRRFVDASDDPKVIEWCRKCIQRFLAGGSQQEELEWLSNEYRNTIRHLAPEMGVAYSKVAKGTYVLKRVADDAVDDIPALRQRLVDAVKALVEEHGGRCSTNTVKHSLPEDLWNAASVGLRLKNVKTLSEVCPTEFQESGLRMNGRWNTFLLGEADGYDDAIFVQFDKAHVTQARRALQAALRKLPAPQDARKEGAWANFLNGRHQAMGASELEREQRRPGYKQMLPLRARLPAFVASEEICEAVREGQVTLILGATGCGKTTQLPQCLLEDCASRDELCRVVATQPRRISAQSVAERVAVERGGKLGDSVAFKIRFEDNVTESTQIIYCTVGILLKVMEGNPDVKGATHIVVDEVHERDLHTDFLLTLLRRVCRRRPDLKLILMSATVDPTAFQSYFPGARTISIPGKTNYPIRELFLEDVLQELPAGAMAQWRRGKASLRKPKASPFSQGPLPGLPMEAASVQATMPTVSARVAGDVATMHQVIPEDIDFDLVQLVVEMIHQSGEEGGVLIFMPGWFEISEMVKKLQGSWLSQQVQLYPLHSRLPSSEQRAIFDPPPPGKRKVIISTILAETSITVEDIVFVIDTGRARNTFFNEATKVAALRTVWYSKANGFQRRGRSGRCRPGTWYRLFTSLQWEAMEDYSMPEMLRSPLEELCLEVASLRLGAPAAFLRSTVSPPAEDVVAHAVRLLYNLGAVTDESGAVLTPLGEKLAKLQVHPMLGKMLLLAGLFRCFNPIMTICASLGYKSPFVCPMGKEKEANAAKRELAGESKSDHVALANAHQGWLKRGRARFANQYFLSPQTMEYIDRLRGDLSTAANDVLKNFLQDHSDPQYLQDVCRAVLVAGLWPNVAWLGRRGKGQTLQGLKVCCHPGSVNSKEGDCVVAFYDIQETTDRWLYDTTVVEMAPCLLFAPRLEEVHRAQRVVFKVESWYVAVDPEVADHLVSLRGLLADFISRSVGQTPSHVHAEATDALGQLFSDHIIIEAGLDEDDGDGAEAAGPIRAGERVEGYWPEDDQWLPVTVLAAEEDGTFAIAWEDASESTVTADYLRRPAELEDASPGGAAGASGAAAGAEQQSATTPGSRAGGKGRGGGHQQWSGGGHQQWKRQRWR